MSFYDFLWQAVKRPELLAEYAERVGMRIEIYGDADFYDRLKQIAIWAVEILEREAAHIDASIPQLRERCRDVARFVAEARMDLEAVGRDASGLRQPRC
ncbi:hypothetical protein TUZN_2013 [Thermoproteus uzoniensis 768-20]|uniref:Uncharacterized protein n=1 Tax=Thermoproteus uzoniensis (strain 768-20) TaxID=999630 RepID=F2L4W7_THEU7|nr:hypothetical protein [Thermoproteus uzoniensis]AEA13471.1 hypothetical protein TUZN_2013 [Thermoproteus uzoniensis 768-20]